MWTEVVMDFWAAKLRTRKPGLFWWVVSAFSFLFVIWLSGLVVYALDGIPLRYLYNIPLHASFFIQGSVILFAVKGFRSFLEQLPTWARPVLRLNREEFTEFFERVERWVSSFFPPLIFAIAMMFLNLYLSRQAVAESLTARSTWGLALSFFMYLFNGTGVWIIVSIWLLVFWVSRQPLDLRLSRRTSKIFRPLAIASLYASACVFLVTSLIPIFYPAASMAQLLIYGFFILLGVLAFLVPFYNIHLVLVRMKRDELSKIEEETSELMGELDKTLAERPTQDSRDRKATITARLLALHVKEKTVREAQEWPVDISFFSAIAGLVLMSMGRMVVELVMRMFL